MEFADINSEQDLVDWYLDSDYDNVREVPVNSLIQLFRAFEGSELRACGDPLPSSAETVEVYRGVAGKGRARRVRGVSWTLSREVAAWFALHAHAKYGLTDPDVYVADVNIKDVWLYTEENGEQEVIMRPPSIYRRERYTVEDLAYFAEEHRPI